MTSPALATVDYSHLHSFHSGWQKNGLLAFTIGVNSQFSSLNIQEVAFQNGSLTIESALARFQKPCQYDYAWNTNLH